MPDQNEPEAQRLTAEVAAPSWSARLKGAGPEVLAVVLVAAIVALSYLYATIERSNTALPLVIGMLISILASMCFSIARRSR